MAKAKTQQQQPTSFADRFITILWGFVQSSVESASRSLSAMQTLADMHKALAADKFLPEVHALFGNGHVKTKERTVGSVIAAIDAKVKEETAKGHTIAIPPGLRAFASKVRKVAESMTMQGMDKVMLRGTEAAYLYATGKTDAEGKKIAKAETPKAETPKAGTPDYRTLIVEYVANGGMDEVLAICESFYTAKADPIHAAVLREARTKVKVA